MVNVSASRVKDSDWSPAYLTTYFLFYGVILLQPGKDMF